MVLCGEGVPPLRVAGILPAGSCGIGILPMTHGLEAHATVVPILPALLTGVAARTRNYPGHLHGPNRLGTPSPDPGHFPL